MLGEAREERQLPMSDQERGEALRDLLELGDRLPMPQRGELMFPRIPCGGGGMADAQG